MMYYYYATKRTVKNGSAQTPANYSYTEHDEAERQYHLLCAAAIRNDEGNEKTSVEWGTIEQGLIERKKWEWPVVTPAEPETEPEQ